MKATFEGRFRPSDELTVYALRKAAGMTQTEFANYFGIPYRTVQKWDIGMRQCADYLIHLMEHKLRNEGIIKGEIPKAERTHNEIIDRDTWNAAQAKLHQDK